MNAPGITSFAKTLSARCKDINLSIRPKAVNHMSLGMGRPDPELRREIQDLYALDPENLKSKATFDIVLSKRTFRGSFDRLDVDGPHQFKEVTRISCSTTSSQRTPVSSDVSPQSIVLPTSPKSDSCKAVA